MSILPFKHIKQCKLRGQACLCLYSKIRFKTRINGTKATVIPKFRILEKSYIIN